MGNYLRMADRQRILALVELGWSYRRIQRETRVRRETVARYDPRRPSKPANLSTGSLSSSPGPVAAAEPYRGVITAAVARGLSAQRIWQDLRETYGYGYSYVSVKRFVRRPWIFRMTLSCSRHGPAEPMWGQDRRAFPGAHEHAFQFFGGLPKTVRHDNLKAAVVRAGLYDPDISELYLAFARHWGFAPLPSRPRHPQEHRPAHKPARQEA